MSDSSHLRVDSVYIYRVSAVDVHGNEGQRSDSLMFTFGDMNLRLTVLIEGLFNEISGKQVKDTVTVLVRNISAPYGVIDSGRVALDSLGKGQMKLPNVQRNNYYYVVIKHRNALETWYKSGGLLMDKSYTECDFTIGQTQAYGNNLVQKGTKWCIYSGDLNHDGAILTDDYEIWFNEFISGLSGVSLLSDLNGDGNILTDDYEIWFNSFISGISKQSPAEVMNILKKKNKKERIQMLNEFLNR